MQGGIETLPLSVLQEILNGRLGAEDLARLESCSSMFGAPRGIVPFEAKSIAEVAAYHSCQMHPVFENLPPRARLVLLARCDGHWKQVLHFMECLLCMPGRSAPAGALSNVVATAGWDHTLIANGKGELYITSGADGNRDGDSWDADSLSSIYRDLAPEPQSTLRLIFSQPTANRILQISANFNHAAFVTETGQVFTFGLNRYHGCGVGLELIPEKILKPALVTALEMIPCQQVTTGVNFTIALTRSGALYSWGYNWGGQLGLGHTRDELRPQEVIMESCNGAPDPVVQVITTEFHVVAVTKAGQLFTWGCGDSGRLGHNNSCNELRPKRVEHGGFGELFIVSASAGRYHSAAIDSSGLVYTWGNSYIGHSCTPVLLDSLEAYRAVQVVAALYSTFVILDNGQVHYFGKDKLLSQDHCDKKESGSLTIKGHKIQSIALGFDHNIMVTMRGAIFGFGSNDKYQLGVVDQSALSGFCYNNIAMPIEVFATITESKGAAKLPDGSIIT